ncbi:unnamed protein product [[Candida] boidinii]|uniref:Unnamed protein product n=1 Tax=Candida boidinii TaxID=5477 RepID=A0ACB5TYD5_CANBO|nr:unnamed protein product [[Candida] boidinii]
MGFEKSLEMVKDEHGGPLETYDELKLELKKMKSELNRRQNEKISNSENIESCKFWRNQYLELLESPKLSKYNSSSFYKQKFNDIKTCLPGIIVDEFDSRLTFCLLEPMEIDSGSIEVEPVNGYATLEQKYNAVISLQDQLICRLLRFEYWPLFLYLVDPHIKHGSLDQFAGVTNNVWNQYMIKLFCPFSIKSDRIDYIQYLLTEEPCLMMNLRNWLLTFIDRVEECGTEDNFNNVRNRIIKILDQHDIDFSPKIIFSIKTYETLRCYILDLDIPKNHGTFLRNMFFKENGINSKVKTPNNK